MIRVIIADDHNLVRQGIRALIEQSQDMVVVGEAQDGAEAVSLTQSLAPDVVVMDMSMPRLSGTHATAQIDALGTATRVIALSMYADKTLVREALRKGAQGYLLKDSVKEELLLAIRAATEGQLYLSPAISQSLVDYYLEAEAAHGADSTAELLSPREHEVLQLVLEGYTNCAIAQMLSISVKTVEKHRASLMAKLEVHDLAGLFRAAVKHHLILLED